MFLEIISPLVQGKHYIIVRILLRHLKKLVLTPFTVSSQKMKTLRIVDYNLEILLIGRNIK